MNYYSKNTISNSSTKKVVDAEEQTNENNIT